MSLIRSLVYTAGIWWILLGIPTLGALAGSMPPQHPSVALAAFVWVVGVVPACVLSASEGKPLRVAFRNAYQAGRTWCLIVGGMALVAIVPVVIASLSR